MAPTRRPLRPRPRRRRSRGYGGRPLRAARGPATTPRTARRPQSAAERVGTAHACVRSAFSPLDPPARRFRRRRRRDSTPPFGRNRAVRDKAWKSTPKLGNSRCGWSATQLTRDHHLLHLVGSLADREDLGVPVEAAHGIFLDVAVAPVDLHGFLRRPDREPAGLQLGLGGGERQLLAAILLDRRLVGEKASRLEL